MKETSNYIRFICIWLALSLAANNAYSFPFGEQAEQTSPSSHTKSFLWNSKRVKTILVVSAGAIIASVAASLYFLLPYDHDEFDSANAVLADGNYSENNSVNIMVKFLSFKLAPELGRRLLQSGSANLLFGNFTALTKGGGHNLTIDNLPFVVDEGVGQQFSAQAIRPIGIIQGSYDVALTLGGPDLQSYTGNVRNQTISAGSTNQTIQLILESIIGKVYVGAEVDKFLSRFQIALDPAAIHGAAIINPRLEFFVDGVSQGLFSIPSSGQISGDGFLIKIDAANPASLQIVLYDGNTKIAQSDTQPLSHAGQNLFNLLPLTSLTPIKISLRASNISMALDIPISLINQIGHLEDIGVTATMAGLSNNNNVGQAMVVGSSASYQALATFSNLNVTGLANPRVNITFSFSDLTQHPPYNLGKCTLENVALSAQDLHLLCRFIAILNGQGHINANLLALIQVISYRGNSLLGNASISMDNQFVGRTGTTGNEVGFLAFYAPAGNHQIRGERSPYAVQQSNVHPAELDNIVVLLSFY